ncbi:MarR family transcriptional regulator [Candidatus Woesearchaeota archaeon]|nr:MarR family transcriptional regulator [Candidatus Woesearchaeota archaeon]
MELIGSENKEITQGRIIIYSGLSKRTVKYALKKLAQERLIAKRVDFSDARRFLYFSVNGGREK